MKVSVMKAMIDNTGKMKWLQRLYAYRSSLTKDMTAQARNDYLWFQKIIRTTTPYCGDLKGKTILDIGCGFRYPLTVLFHNFGSNVTGIDLEYIGIGDPLVQRWWKRLCLNGLEVTGRSLLYVLLKKQSRYYKALEQVSGISPLNRDVDIRHMNVEKMDFPDETFDLIVSLATFEHVHDVANAVGELSRVMKKGAIAWVNIHLFASLSGGHHPEWSYPGSTTASRVPPWDHLREKKYPVHGCYLNKLREDEYLRIFGERLEIIEVLDEGMGEGKAFLTPNIRRELSNYSDEELLKRGITIIAKKC